MFYPSDLNDAEWQIIAPFLPAEKSVGSPREVNLRAVVNAIFYRADNGIKWRAMPIDFPPWQTVYTYYRLWCDWASGSKSMRHWWNGYGCKKDGTHNRA